MNRDDHLTEMLSTPDVWADAPDVLDRVLEGVEESTPGRVRRWGVVAAAALVVLLIGIGVSDLFRTDPVDFVLAGTELAPSASADVRIIDTPAGVVLRLAVFGLDPAGPGTYYQGWVVAGEDAVSVGTFHMRGGDGAVSLWSGVDPERFRMLIVTVQSEDAGPARSDRVVLRGQS
jgi:hypothetical protein